MKTILIFLAGLLCALPARAAVFGSTGLPTTSPGAGRFYLYESFSGSTRKLVPTAPDTNIWPGETGYQVNYVTETGQKLVITGEGISNLWVTGGALKVDLATIRASCQTPKIYVWAFWTNEVSETWIAGMKIRGRPWASGGACGTNSHAWAVGAAVHAAANSLTNGHGYHNTIYGGTGGNVRQVAAFTNGYTGSTYLLNEVSLIPEIPGNYDLTNSEPVTLEFGRTGFDEIFFNANGWNLTFAAPDSDRFLGTNVTRVCWQINMQGSGSFEPFAEIRIQDLWIRPADKAGLGVEARSLQWSIPAATTNYAVDLNKTYTRLTLPAAMAVLWETNRSAGAVKSTVVLLVNTNATAAALYWPTSSWRWLGTLPALPTSLAAGKVGVLSLTSTGDDPTNTIAAYSVQP